MSMTRTLNSPITIEEVTRFCDAKIPEGASKCPRCGHDNWGLLDESSDGVAGIAISNEHSLMNSMYAVMLLNCQNCGFVAPHAKSVIVKWLNENE